MTAPICSIWSETSNLPSFEPLHSDLKTDVLIIGGGIAGILFAYMLENSGVDYVLVEANRICSGVTRNTIWKHRMLFTNFCILSNSEYCVIEQNNKDCPLY